MSGTERQQRRIDEAHRIQVDLAPRKIAQDRVGIAQQAQRQRAAASVPSEYSPKR